ncbi:Mono- and diacylglycerol lipase [Hypsizygus marmoreus]|uniref:Mono- and diacylglycerol lipase n=1 Tax=Hypsizygus marmoreus TaxID=39966 RepID=A0A369KFY8_HYPMA|nr:Mono- and diacylglycerol lipase [Hypsizygus marmoreus]
MHWKRKYTLTEEQRRMYASEKLMNFRWISKVVATRSSYMLRDANLASPEVTAELAELGQFAEVVYSAVPFDFIFQNIAMLSEPDFPLEGYDALQPSILASSLEGRVGRLPAYIVYRPSTKQLVVAISGTSSVQLALHDIRTLKHRHPSRCGHVHSGFWALYKGIKPLMFDAIRKGIREHDVDELVVTGHSMGGSISYLLCMDLLSTDGTPNSPLSPGLKLKLAVFGSPRTGDAKLVGYWRELITAYRKSYGPDHMTEYSVKAYNDGVPALPPSHFGFRHFAQAPLYLDRSQLYHVPPSEAEHALFEAASYDPNRLMTLKFPRGGHNYYNGHDLERLMRRFLWLDKAEPEKDSWEERYRQAITKHRATA